jgi:hypothetical protein
MPGWTYRADQKTKTLSASAVALASSSIVLRCTPSISSASPIPRASKHVPHSSTIPLDDHALGHAFNIVVTVRRFLLSFGGNDSIRHQKESQLR